MLRGLTYHWRSTLAVLAAAAVATAVLVGAVIVGDSLTASLRHLTLDRLGGIDWAVVTQEPFRRTLAGEVRERLESDHQMIGVSAASAFLLTGSAIHPDSGRLAGGVQLLGVDDDFGAFYGDDGARLLAALERTPGQLFPSVVVNRSLARELGVDTGDQILLNLRPPTDIPRQSLLGNRPDAPRLAGLRGTVTEILPDRGPGRFTLEAHQALSRNAFVSMEVLERRLDRPQGANTLLIGTSGAPLDDPAVPTAVGAALTLDDLGLEARPADGVLRISNRRFVLRDSTVEAVRRTARAQGLATQTLLGYIANRMTLDGRLVPYSMVMGVEAPTAAPFGDLRTVDGEPLPPLGDSEIVLGAWAAGDLGAAPGDEIEMSYFAVGPDDALAERSARFRVAAVAAMEGLMVAGNLLPDFPGIADADDIAAWEPPFPLDLGLVRPRDEAFWDRYGAAPKAIVGLETAQRLWGNRFGRATVVRVAAGPRQRQAFLDAWRSELDPGTFGLVPQPVKHRGLEASAGATDFAGLFLAFSFFLIGAAALVVGLLFSLAVERRASEVGLRRALGFPLADVRRLLLGEGLAVASAGGVVGTALAVAYAGGLIRVISGLWEEQLDLPLLRLALDPLHIAVTLGAAIALVALTIALTLRRLRRTTIPALLRANLRGDPGGRRGRRARRLAIGSALLAATTLVTAVLRGGGSSPAYFFAAGILSLVAGLAAFAWWIDRPGGEIHRAGWRAPLTMAIRNGAFNPRRSLLSVSLVCCATFLLVSVAANRRDLDPGDLGRDSGTGGFAVIAESSIPLGGHLDSPATADEVALSAATRRLVAAGDIVSLRLRPGEDASCLNLYQPRRPRVVGVPPQLVERGGFHFTAVTEESANPWTLLEQDLGDGVVPAIGDANSVTWILHAGLGEEIEMVDDRGRPFRLRLVGLLDKSIFQSELLIAERAFVERFPQHGGYSYFLADAPPGRVDELLRALETDLADYGFDATRTSAKLARFLGIEEMYLSTFQLLGGLGLILGTVGLGVVLLRNVNERRGELAMLRAVGFRRRSIAWVIGLETTLHLLVGLAIGTAAGFLALTPHFLDASLDLPWGTLVATLATVVAVGLVSTTLGVAAALRSPLLPALKAE